MTDNEAATEPRWWNEDTTYSEIVKRYAEDCGLTPENVERFVADHGDSETVKQYADRIGEDLESSYNVMCEGLICGWLKGGWRVLDDYYTVKQLATQALQHLYRHPRELFTTATAVYEFGNALAVLSKKCDDSVRVVALDAAAKAAERITSEELKAVLATLAEIKIHTEIGAELNAASESN